MTIDAEEPMRPHFFACLVKIANVTRLSVKAINPHFLLVLLVSILGLEAHAEPTLGLKFASDSQLAGIPLASTPFSGASLPTSVDLSGRLPPPGNQGNQQSCVAWAVAYGLKSYQEFLEENVPIANVTGQLNPNRIFSPAYIYNQINQQQDGGSLISDALNVLSSRGAATWASMPYNPSDHLTQPSSGIHSAAQRYRIDYWRRVNVFDPKEVKAQLAAGYPVIIGAVVDQGFAGQAAATTWDKVSGAQLGGHAMLIVGYDDSRSAFKILNSWGTNWADGGYGWISYGFFPSVVREGYVAKDAVNTGPVPPTPPSGPNNPTSPNAPPAVHPGIQIQIAGVQHNIPSASGPGMLITGNFILPAGTPGVAQIVVQIYANNNNQKGAAIAGLIPAHRTIHGAAATGTPPFTAPAGGLNTQWYAHMPYNALSIPRGMTFGPYGPVGIPITSYLLAEPVLFIDNFGVKTATLIPFTVGL